MEINCTKARELMQLNKVVRSTEVIAFIDRHIEKSAKAGYSGVRWDFTDAPIEATFLQDKQLRKQIVDHYKVLGFTKVKITKRYFDIEWGEEND